MVLKLIGVIEDRSTHCSGPTTVMGTGICPTTQRPEDPDEQIISDYDYRVTFCVRLNGDGPRGK